MRLTHSRLILFILAVLISTGIRFNARAQISDSARVSILTIYPGDAIYALWGHSALRIEDPVTQTDISYNYGTFDFRNPLSFILRFAYGKLDYQLSLHYSPSLVEDSWVSLGRGVVEQQLSMTVEETRALYQYLSINALPSNRVYRYDFLYDNCATRILDALEYALQTEIADSTSTGITFRNLIQPYLRAHAGLDLAINLAMGIPVDQEATQRQLSFLPIELQVLLENAQTRTGTPLVAQTDTLFGNPVTPEKRRTMSFPTIMGWLILLAALLLFVRDVSQPSRRVFDTVLLGIVTVLGLLITFFWLVSLHEITRPNLHILWAWPLHVLPLFFSRKPWTTLYWYAATCAAAVFVFGAPWWAQSLPHATIPMALAVALRCFILARVPRTGFEPVLPA